MRNRVRKSVLVVAGMALACAGPVQARPACWSEADMDAAKVRDLQSRLMVATLRCQGAGFDITPAYNRFVVANRPALQGVNGVLMTQFRSGFGEEAQVEYDRYATALANAYGGDATDRDICANSERLAEEAAGARGNLARLVALHSRSGLPPPRPGAACTAHEVLAADPAAQRPAERRPDARPLGWLELEEDDGTE
jgi:hypothetical protein